MKRITADDLVTWSITDRRIPPEARIWLSRHPDKALVLVTEMAKRSQWEARFWAAAIAGECIGPTASALLVRLGKDRRSEVGTEAIGQLVVVSPETAEREFLPAAELRLLEGPWSLDVTPPALALVAQLGAGASGRAVAAFSSREDVPPLFREIARALGVYLAEGREGIMMLLERHDSHRSLLSGLLWVVREAFAERVTPKSLRDLAASDPDENCRQLLERYARAIEFDRSSSPAQ